VANFITIDLDSQGFFAVCGVARGVAKVTHAIAWTGEDGDPPPALTIDTAKAVGEKLRDKLRAAGALPAPVIVSVGRDRTILKELKYPPVPPTEEPALVRFQAMKEMSESPDDIVLDYAPLGEAGGERRSMAVVMRKELFNAINAMCAAANFKLAGVTPRPYATAAGLTHAFATKSAPPPADKGDAVAALTLGPGGGEFTVVRRGEVTFTLAIPVPVVASETMLVAQIRRNLTVYAGQHPGHPITAIYLAEVDGPWEERLSRALSVPVHAFDPLAGAAPDVAESLRGRFAGAVGLLAGRAANTLPINFASPRQPRIEADPVRKRLKLVAMASFLLLAVGLIGGIAYAQYKTSGIQDRVAKRNDLKKQVDDGTPNANRVKGIDGWSGREVNWLDEMYELADRMPADDSVRVLSLEAKPVPPDKNGKQDSQATLDLKLGATNNAAGTALADAFEHDNPTANKYYVGTNVQFPGTAGNASSRHKEAVLIKMKVNRREPVEYTQNTRFAPPKKTAGSAGIANVPPPVATAPPVEPPLEAAPPPAEKAGAGE
jgi:hypothetical protein